VNPDFVVLLRELSAAEARFLVVGAFAVSFHARPRATGTLDIWIEPTAANAAKAIRALTKFGAPMTDIRPAALVKPRMVYQIGVLPRRIDLLTSLTALVFEEAWASRVPGRIGGVEVPFIGRDALMRNKRAVGRPQDLADLESLGGGG
jgi:hypothetical protein